MLSLWMHWLWHLTLLLWRSTLTRALAELHTLKRSEVQTLESPRSISRGGIVPASGTGKVLKGFVSPKALLLHVGKAVRQALLLWLVLGVELVLLGLEQV